MTPNRVYTFANKSLSTPFYLSETFLNIMKIFYKKIYLKYAIYSIQQKNIKNNPLELKKTLTFPISNQNNSRTSLISNLSKF